MSNLESRKSVLEKLTKRKLDDCRKGGTTWRTKRGKLRSSLREQVSGRRYKNVCSKVSKHCAHIRANLKSEKLDRVKWLVKKYGIPTTVMSELPDNLSEFKECKTFDLNTNMVKEEMDGVEIVLMEGETINLSDCERKLLMRGPGYCILKSVKEEGFCCALEECIVKHKWECLNEEEDEEPPCLEVPSPEELKELEKIQALANHLTWAGKKSLIIRRIVGSPYPGPRVQKRRASWR